MRTALTALQTTTTVSVLDHIWEKGCDPGSLGGVLISMRWGVACIRSTVPSSVMRGGCGRLVSQGGGCG